MKALVLAAGRGQRMRPLTDHTPKPLLRVQGKPLLHWTLDALAQAGVQSVVINTDWLGHQIEDALGASLQTGSGQHLSITYSHEGRDFGGALETLGGICRALPLLARHPDDAFWVVAGDAYMPGFAFEPVNLHTGSALGHVWLVPNPPHNRNGDFAVDANGWLCNSLPDGTRGLTFSTVGLYRRALFEPPWCSIEPGNRAGVKAPLAPLLRLAADNRLLSASVWQGAWADVGTPERLAELNAPGDQ